MTIRKATKRDIATIVDIHIQRFSTFFLSSLGKAFLKTFYTAFLMYPALLIVVEDEVTVKGFAAVRRVNCSFFYILVMNNFLFFTCQGIQVLFNNPSALRRMASNAGKSEKNNLIFAELLSIATIRNKKGYGKALLNEFEREVAKENSLNLPISLTTDYDDNEKAIQFYKDCGYRIHEVFHSYQGRKMYRFIK